MRGALASVCFLYLTVEAIPLSSVYKDHLLSPWAGAERVENVFLRFKKSGTGSINDAIFHRVCWNCLADASQSIEAKCVDEEVFRSYGSAGGLERTLACAPDVGARKRLFVILRDPLERAVSAFYFWGRTDRNAPVKKQALAFYAIPPHEVSWANVTAVRKCAWDACVYFGNTNPLTAATLSQTLGDGNVRANERSAGARYESTRRTRSGGGPRRRSRPSTRPF